MFDGVTVLAGAAASNQRSAIYRLAPDGMMERTFLEEEFRE
jgi:hypothetical protein